MFVLFCPLNTSSCPQEEIEETKKQWQKSVDDMKKNSEVIRKQTIEDYRESILTCSKLDSVFTKVSMNTTANNTTAHNARRGRRGGGRGRGRGGARRANHSAAATPAATTAVSATLASSGSSHNLSNGRAHPGRRAPPPPSAGGGGGEEQSAPPKVNGFSRARHSNANITDSPSSSSSSSRSHRASARGVPSLRLRGAARARSNTLANDDDSFDRIRRSPRKTDANRRESPTRAAAVAGDGGDDKVRSMRSSLRRKLSDRF